MGSANCERKIRFLARLIVLLLLVAFSRAAYAQTGAIEPRGIGQLSDAAIIRMLGSLNVEAAHQAVLEVMRRGEHMLPLLLRCRGNRRFFYGYGLGHRRSSSLVPVPSYPNQRNDGSIITIEVAALYLISAIYYQNLEFAQAPYLDDGTRVEWRRYNTPRRVVRAWRSTMRWAQALEREGMESLRSRRQSPLRNSGVSFW